MQCRSYALDAERKMGELLRDSERAQGKRTDLVPKGNQVAEPTLAELGLSKKESMKAQSLALMPDPLYEALKSGKTTRTEVRRQMQRAIVREQAVAEQPLY